MIEATKLNRSLKRTGKPNGLAGNDKPEAPVNASASRRESKASLVIALLQRQDGASLEELVAETGWQPHTTRAALTGLRKKGHVISSDKVDGVRRYRAAVPR